MSLFSLDWWWDEDPDEELNDLLEQMSEPPGGHGHGRKRTPEGGWADLDENVAASYQEHLHVELDEIAYRRPDKPDDTIRHGTYSAYTNDGCRCERCRDARAEYHRRRRDIGNR